MGETQAGGEDEMFERFKRAIRVRRREEFGGVDRAGFLE
jgi:hypothetical protein